MNSTLANMRSHIAEKHPTIGALHGGNVEASTYVHNWLNVDA
ncbi:hypothetical protein [Mycoplana ramosa]|uniref:Uncharacterized protein n=1 Tax=Mycoplana ramosa TaxID=40837 RepID=A0ABW3Z2C7_MYCRA